MSVKKGDLVGAKLGEIAKIISNDPNGVRASACADALAHQGCDVTIAGADPSSNVFRFNTASVRDRGIPTVQSPSPAPGLHFDSLG
ncbi:MAG TPA: hypothetical protein PKI93_08115 [Alphaproteobacteria bacterium]|nr:hypothetical protein [Alphaproteobacteria bacterium]HNS44275.1 hypothetical protein [Alphaproteobacteria bacterium]